VGFNRLSAAALSLPVPAYDRSSQEKHYRVVGCFATESEAIFEPISENREMKTEVRDKPIEHFGNVSERQVPSDGLGFTCECPDGKQDESREKEPTRYGTQ
jgi:hypothetical protein